MFRPFGTIYLSGVRLPELDEVACSNLFNANDEYERIPLGILIQPATKNYLKTGPECYNLVGIDNGCFSAEGRKRFEIDKYLQLINHTLNAFGESAVLFATAEDVVGDWENTLRKSLPMLPLIRSVGAPAALVLQDGATVVDIPWSELDAIFIGGSTEWKLSRQVYDICREATARKKWIHMGRVNSAVRARTALEFGCGSMDGTFLKFAGAAGVETLLDWLRESWDLDPARRLWRFSGRIDPDHPGGDWLYYGGKGLIGEQQLEFRF